MRNARIAEFQPGQAIVPRLGAKGGHALVGIKRQNEIVVVFEHRIEHGKHDRVIGIDEHIKEEATAVLASMGLTVSDAFRMMLTRIAREKALPFEPLVPNAETIEAMKEARSGKLASFDNLDALRADLNAKD